jgi:phage gp46-like protein
LNLSATNGEIDLDPQGGDDLESAVIISLFTDQRALADEVKLPDHRRGYWGDLLGNSGSLGSKLWLLQREKIAQETLELAEQYAKEALQWLIDDQLVSSIDVRASWDGEGKLQLDVSLDGRDLIAFSHPQGKKS